MMLSRVERAWRHRGSIYDLVRRRLHIVVFCERGAPLTALSLSSIHDDTAHVRAYSSLSEPHRSSQRVTQPFSDPGLRRRKQRSALGSLLTSYPKTMQRLVQKDVAIVTTELAFRGKILSKMLDAVAKLLANLWALEYSCRSNWSHLRSASDG